MSWGGGCCAGQGLGHHHYSSICGGGGGGGEAPAPAATPLAAAHRLEKASRCSWRSFLLRLISLARCVFLRGSREKGAAGTVTLGKQPCQACGARFLLLGATHRKASAGFMSRPPFFLTMLC